MGLGEVMGYFPNGTEGMIYEEKYCADCVHINGADGESGCAVFLAHLMHNSAGCNDDKSILHILIPISKSGRGNEKCTMFHSSKAKFDRRRS